MRSLKNPILIAMKELKNDHAKPEMASFLMEKLKDWFILTQVGS